MEEKAPLTQEQKKSFAISTNIGEGYRKVPFPMALPKGDKEDLMNQITTEMGFLSMLVGKRTGEIFSWNYRVFPVVFPSFSREVMGNLKCHLKKLNLKIQCL